MEENKKAGFGTGLGIGLAVGGVILVIALCIEAYVMKTLLPTKSEILDKETSQKIALLEETIDKYFYNYNEEEISREDMQRGLYDGLVDSLNDSYAQYFSEEELQQLLIDNQGIYYGVGAYISIGEDGYPVFSKIMDDSPALASGLHANDVIISVDELSAYGMTLDEVVSHVKGENGTSVHLTIFREGEEDYLEFDVERGPIESVTVNAEMLEGKIGYIQIGEFDGVTVSQFEKAYNELREQNAKGLIIDLRSNLGGLVTSVVEIGRQILPEGVIVYEEDVNGNRKEYRGDGLSEIDIPLVILVNQYSASASEILSGAVKDYEIGTLVGTTTYGKGIVQDTKLFSDGTALKLTVAAYYSPNGHNIQGTGIEPDVEVELDLDKYYDEGIDTQLDKAVDVIKQKMK